MIPTVRGGALPAPQLPGVIAIYDAPRSTAAVDEEERMWPDPVTAFVNAINERDVRRLGYLMTEDHRFIDSMGAEVRGRAKVVAGWTAYFALFPDYEVRIQQRFVDGNLVALFGCSCATHAGSGREVQMRAAWLAEVRGDQVAEWRVYADNEPARAALEGR